MRIGWIRLDGLAQASDRHVGSADLLSDGTQQIQGIGVCPLRSQNLSAQFLSAGKVALLISLPGLGHLAGRMSLIKHWWNAFFKANKRRVMATARAQSGGALLWLFDDHLGCPAPSQE